MRSHVHPSGTPAFLAALQHPDARPLPRPNCVIADMRLNYIDRIIHRAVIDYQILKITKVLLQYQLMNSSTDIFGDVIGGRHDRDKR